MKIITTQLTGLLQRIASSSEESIEETARLLAQAAVGEGRIIFAGFGEMDAVTLNALTGAEPFTKATRFVPGMEIGSADRVWILSRSSMNEEALKLARGLSDSFIPFAAVAAEKNDEQNELSSLAYTYISTGINKGILPGPDGQRILEPHAIAALFIYEAVKASYDEMLRDE